MFNRPRLLRRFHNRGVQPSEEVTHRIFPEIHDHVLDPPVDVEFWMPLKFGNRPGDVQNICCNVEGPLRLADNFDTMPDVPLNRCQNLVDAGALSAPDIVDRKGFHAENRRIADSQQRGRSVVDVDEVADNVAASPISTLLPSSALKAIVEATPCGRFGF